VNATRKIPSPLPRATARRIVGTYAVWQTEIVAPLDIQLASDLEEQHQLDFWDALIVAARPQGWGEHDSHRGHERGSQHLRSADPQPLRRVTELT